VLVTRLAKPTLPASALTPCSSPVPLPDRSLTAGETVKFWGRDRAALRICEARRAAAVRSLEN
jgi:hypothetical protein